MQSTGQASTQAVSLVPMQGSAITYAIWIYFPVRDRPYHSAEGKNKLPRIIPGWRSQRGLFFRAAVHKPDDPRDGRIFEFLDILNYGDQNRSVLLHRSGLLLLGPRVQLLSGFNLVDFTRQ